MPNSSFWIVLFVVLTMGSFGDAYLLPPPSRFETRTLARTVHHRHHRPASSALYMAKKRRRRKSEPSTSLSGNEMDIVSDLPDFDMGEDDGEAAPPKMPSISSDEITDAMMSSSSKPLGSVKDLLSDRSLESKLQFEEPDNPLPDFAELAQKSRSGRGATTTTTLEPGSKRARQAERKAAAQARDEADQEGGFLSNLPFIGGGGDSKEAEDDPFKFVKALETGAWIGIFLLIAWEVYINSPLFERAAPLIPVVELFL